jgi:hypothetical protein
VGLAEGVKVAVAVGVLVGGSAVNVEVGATVLVGAGVAVGCGVADWQAAMTMAAMAIKTMNEILWLIESSPL